MGALDARRLLDERGVTLDGGSLLRSASAGELDVVHLLLAAGVDVEATNEDGETPLMLASENGHLDVVERLLEAGADVDARGADGRTPLVYAIDRGNGDVMRRLLAAHGRGGGAPSWTYMFGVAWDQWLTPLCRTCGVPMSEVAAENGRVALNCPADGGMYPMVDETKRWLTLAEARKRVVGEHR